MLMGIEIIVSDESVMSIGRERIVSDETIMLLGREPIVNYWTIRFPKLNTFLRFKVGTYKKASI